MPVVNDDDFSMRGFQRMAEFLRVEMQEPDLPVSRVAQWARAGKLDVDRFGRNAISTKRRLRKSIGHPPA